MSISLALKMRDMWISTQIRAQAKVMSFRPLMTVQLLLLVMDLDLKAVSNLLMQPDRKMLPLAAQMMQKIGISPTRYSKT